MSYKNSEFLQTFSFNYLKSWLGFESKFKMMIKSLFAVFLLASTTSSLFLDCTYSMRNLWQSGNIYTCTARVILVGDPRNVTDVSRNHLAGRNHSDVLGLSYTNQNIRELPRNVDDFFPNLESIDVTISLEEISREDLSPFPKLRQLHLNSNRIQVVNSNLFAGNPQMFAISFISNPVRNVAPGVFDHLNLLTHLRFDSVPCHNGQGQTRDQVLNLLPRIYAGCPPTFDMNYEMIKNRLLEDLSFTKHVDEQISERINPLTMTVFEIDQRLARAEEDIKRLEQDRRQLTLISEFLKNNQGKTVRI